MEPNAHAQPVAKSTPAASKAGLQVNSAFPANLRQQPGEIDRRIARIKRVEGLVKGLILAGLISLLEITGLVLSGLATLSPGLWAVLILSFVAWFFGILAWCFVYELQAQEGKPSPYKTPEEDYRPRSRRPSSVRTYRPSQHALFSASLPATIRLTAAPAPAPARRCRRPAHTRPIVRIRRAHHPKGD